MRGKVLSELDSPPIKRITPAYAGKSSAGLSPFQACTDHPRLCGEKVVADVRKLSEKGSPPPMRGKAATGKWIGI